MSVVGSRPKRKPCTSNCATCGHQQASGDGWCYMFKDAPEGRCYLHTGEEKPLSDIQHLIRQTQLMTANKRRHDFEALRVERNRLVMEQLEKLAGEVGVQFSSPHSSFNSSACYCACSSGGPCEHQWDGEGIEIDDGAGWTATCSRCGCTAMSHSLRTGR